MAGKGRLPSRGEDGFTLVEVLVAMSIFGVFLTAVVGIFISGARSVADQRLRAAATRLASDRLETLRGLPFDQVDGIEQLLPKNVTLSGTTFTVETTAETILADTGGLSATLPAIPELKKITAKPELKKITAKVTWSVPGGGIRTVSSTTAVGHNPRVAVAEQAIGVITMFPSPTTTDPAGRPLQDIEVTVPMVGFTAGTLVTLSWTNKDDLIARYKTLTSTTGLNWRGTIAKDQVLAALGADGRGQVGFTASAGTLSAKYDLSVQKVTIDPPVITGAAIDRNPIHVAAPTGTKSCAAVNQCQNTTEVVFTLTTTGLNLDAKQQDSVVLQFQLFDGTYQEVPLSPVSGQSGQWRLAVRQKTTKFRAGTARAFRFIAIRSDDGATAGFTLTRNVTVVSA